MVLLNNVQVELDVARGVLYVHATTDEAAREHGVTPIRIQGLPLAQVRQLTMNEEWHSLDIHVRSVDGCCAQRGRFA